MILVVKEVIKIIVLSCFVWCGNYAMVYNDKTVKIMTYNMEYGGNNRRAIESRATAETYAKIIKESNADIVAFQESVIFEIKDKKYSILKNTTEEIAKVLGWNFIIQKYNNDYATSIITRFTVKKLYKIDDMYNALQRNITIAVRLKVNDEEILIINDHLRDEPYQPFILNDNKGIPNPKEFILSNIISAYNTRSKQLFETIDNLILLEENKRIPTFLTGDFNEPSHLDWTKKSYNKGICPYEVKWPTSNGLIERGFQDSFRSIYPDVDKFPGISWSLKLPEDAGERFDRIDYIYFKNSIVINANNFDPGLSDHAAFIAEFKLK